MQGWLPLVGLTFVGAAIAVAVLLLVARSESRPKKLESHGTAGRAMAAGFMSFDDFLRGRQPTAIVAQEQAVMDGEQESRLGGVSGQPSEAEGESP